MNKLLFFSVAVTTLASFGDTVKLGALVLDAQTAAPVAGAEVRAGFKTDNGLLARDRYSYEFKKYVTDKTGRVEIGGTSNSGKAGITVERADGFYCPARGGGPQYRTKNFFCEWQPDNLVVTIKLQRVEHPIPLFVKRELLNVKQEIANINGGKFSYDLMMGEWLPPFGNGKIADIEFTRLRIRSLPKLWVRAD